MPGIAPISSICFASTPISPKSWLPVYQGPVQVLGENVLTPPVEDWRIAAEGLLG